jgi:hypothetical protein
MVKSVITIGMIVGLAGSGKPLLTSATTLMAAPQNARRAPEPLPEWKKLDYFLGNWVASQQVTATRPAISYTSKDQSEWVGIFLVTRVNMAGPSKLDSPGVELRIMGYDPVERVYTCDLYGDHPRMSFRGTFEGDTLTLSTDDGLRYSIKMLSDSEYSFKFETPPPPTGGPWETIGSGSARRAN